MKSYARYYDFNVAILKRYGNELKLVRMNAVRKRGYEIPDLDKRERGTVNADKLDNNIRRAKNKVYEYAKCNHWSWFVTLTLDSGKYNRYDLKTYIKDLGQFLHNQNRTRKRKIQYLIIPEQHKNGAWHLHALMEGLATEELTPYQTSDFKNGRIPDYIRKKLEQGEPVYRWEKYAERFGYCLFDAVQNEDAIAKYIMKYFTKDLSRSVTELNSKLYYCSHGLKKAEELKRGRMLLELEPDFKNEYCMVNIIDWLVPEQEQDFINSVIEENFKQVSVALGRNALVNIKRLEELHASGFKLVNRRIRKLLKTFNWRC